MTALLTTSTEQLWKDSLLITSQTSQNWACIFTSNCLQEKTMSFLFYFSLFEKVEMHLRVWECGWERGLSWMWSAFNGGYAAALWPAGTAHTVRTKQNRLTFNKYLCTQCYIHELYIGTQEWVWIVASYFIAENTKLCLCYCSQMHCGCEEILFFI